MAIAIVVWVLPWYLRRQCIDSAAAHGVEMTIESAQVDASGFRLLGVRAALADVPGVVGQVPEVRVQTRGLHPEAMTMRGAELTLDGAWTQVGSALAKWRAKMFSGEAGPWMPVSLAIDDSHVAWKGVIGENARVEASGVHVDVTWRSRNPELHLRSDHVVVAVPGGALGPWRIDFNRVPPGGLAADRSPVPASARLRLAFDPGVPESSTVLVMADEERTTSVDVAVPRSPLARLGVPLALVGVRGKDLQIEASAHYAASGPKRADARTKGGVYGIQAQGLPRPIDIAWEVAANGSAETGLDVTAGRLAVGPLVGAMTGMLKAFEDGFRVNLAWKAGPVPCKAFDAPLAAGAPFDIAYQLRKLAEATGITKIDGDVTARASLAFDSRDLSVTRLDFAPEASCQVALFAP